MNINSCIVRQAVQTGDWAAAILAFANHYRLDGLERTFYHYDKEINVMPSDARDTVVAVTIKDTTYVWYSDRGFAHPVLNTRRSASIPLCIDVWLE